MSDRRYIVRQEPIAPDFGWECDRCGGCHPTFADLLVCIEQDRLTPERARLVAERIENRLGQETS